MLSRLPPHGLLASLNRQQHIASALPSISEARRLNTTVAASSGSGSQGGGSSSRTRRNKSSSLLRIPGVGPKYEALLLGRGVTSVPELVSIYQTHGAEAVTFLQVRGSSAHQAAFTNACVLIMLLSPLTSLTQTVCMPAVVACISR